MRVKAYPFLAVSTGLVIGGKQIQGFSPHEQAPKKITPRCHSVVRGQKPLSFRAAPTNPSAHRLFSLIEETDRNDKIQPPTLNNKKLQKLLPVEQFMGWEVARQLPINHNPLSQNYFFRRHIPGMGVSPHWPSRVRNLSEKGPFPVNRQLIDLTLSSGKKISVVIDYPSQKELFSDKPLPMVIYNPPGFIGEVPLIFGKCFYDAQIGLPFMNHLASYGMVSATLLDPGSVLFDGVDKVNHQQQAAELNEVIDQLTIPGVFSAFKLPVLNPNRIGLLAYSRGAKVALMAAAERIQRNKQYNLAAKVVSVAKDPVNLGGVPPAVLAQIPQSIKKLIPEETLTAWEQSSHRYPLVPTPGQMQSDPYPIETLTDPVLIFGAQAGFFNPDLKYGARAIFDKLPKAEGNHRLFVEINGEHESWVNDYAVKGDTMAIMAAYFLKHLCDRKEFNRVLEPETLTKSYHRTIKQGLIR